MGNGGVHDHANASGERLRATRTARKETQRAQREENWSRGDFFHDLGRASRRITREIEADPHQAEALERSREQAREGRVISQEDFDKETSDEDE